MLKIIKAEFIKEKRSANSKLQLLVPIIFVIFNVLMVGMMGVSPVGRSYIMATSFNWYPVMILPIVLSLLVVNIVGKEKSEHVGFQKSLNLSVGKIFISKNILVSFELFTIFLLSSIGIYCVGLTILNEEVSLWQLIIATICLFTGSLPIISLSFLIYMFFKKKFLVILINFIMTFPSAIIATTDNWKIFPWAYNLRILSPVIGVHPNGTFLEAASYANELRCGISRKRLFFAKFIFIYIVLIVIELFSVLPFVLFMKIQSREVNLVDLTLCSAICSVTIMSMVPIYQFLSLKFSYAGSILFGAVSTLAAILLGTTDLGQDIWKVFPFVWPVKLMFGYASHILTSSTIMLLLILSFIITMAVLLIFSFWYNKWDGITRMEE